MFEYLGLKILYLHEAKKCSHEAKKCSHSVIKRSVDLKKHCLFG